MQSQIAECDAHPLATESPTWQCQSFIVLTDHQSTESMNELEQISPCQEGIDSQLAENDSSTDQSFSEVIYRANIPDLHAVKEIETQTNSSAYLSTLTVDLKFKPIALAYYIGVSKSSVNDTINFHPHSLYSWHLLLVVVTPIIYLITHIKFHKCLLWWSLN